MGCKGISLRTSMPFQILPLAILVNMPLVLTTLFKVEVDNFSVSAKYPSHDLRLLESIFFHNFSPNLNNQASSFPLQILS